jgi:gamma-glutamylcyclotransferase (GGCT)/AIG2-like uncharacterized protein YtfP
VTLYFAYGANLSRAVMRKHAPAAEPIGVASLSHYRFVIAADGYASVESNDAGTVHGALWRLNRDDRTTLDAWENVADGLYRAETMSVMHAGDLHRALVYIARSGEPGEPRPGYIELVIAAALEWQLPDGYIETLRRWQPRQPAAGPRKLGEFEWT